MGYGIVVHLLNMRELVAYYGNAVAQDVSSELYRRVRQVCGGQAVTPRVGSEGVIVGRPGTLDERERRFNDCDYLDRLLASVTQPEAECPLLRNIAVLEARYVDSSPASPGPEPRALRIPASAISSSLELASDVMDRGIMLAGGGSLLQGLDERLRDETQMPAHRAESPLTCVAVGSGRSLEEFEAIHRSNRNNRNRRPRR